MLPISAPEITRQSNEPRIAYTAMMMTDAKSSPAARNTTSPIAAFLFCKNQTSFLMSKPAHFFFLFLSSCSFSSRSNAASAEIRKRIME